LTQAGGKKLTLAQNSLLNTIGTVVFYVCQWALTLLVVRMGTEADVGTLQLALTVTNIFTSLANYNMRAFQVSDIRNEYTAGHYVASRLVTGLLALVTCMVYSLLWGYGGISLLCIGLYMGYRLSESLGDVLHGIDQKHSRMDHVMVSYVLRGILMLACFWMALRWTGSLPAAIAGIAAVTWAVVLLYDLRSSARYESIRPRFEGEPLKRLLLACLPSVLASVAFAAIVSLPRQVLGKMEGETLLGFYATVATPLVFVQVFLNSLMNPALGALAESWEKNDQRAFRALTLKMLLLIAAVGLAVLAGVLLLAEPVMMLLYGETIRPYVCLMAPIVACTTMYAVCCVGFNLLVVLRKMVTLLWISLGAVLVSAGAAAPMIRLFGANGVSWCVLASYALFAGMSFFFVLRGLREKNKESC